MVTRRNLAMAIALTLLFSGTAYAGSTNQTNPPTDDSTRMYTVEQVYTKAASGTTTAKPSGGFNEPAAGPGSTMHTLDEIYAKIAAGITTAAAGDVLDGKTFITRVGADSGEAMVPGVMTDNTGLNVASVTQSQAAEVNYFTVPIAGYYDDTAKVSATDAQVAALDADIVEGNIKNTVTIFGVLGTYTGTSVAGGIPKTGQTVQYSGKPDDGYYQMGNTVTPRFTAGAGAEAGTVTDNATGLMWEQKTNDSTIHDYDDTYTWVNAFDVFLNGAAGLNTVSFAGYADWRIPNVRELQSIADYGTWSPAINSIFNSGGYLTQASNYWSSTTVAVSTGLAWYVPFDNGYVYSNDKANSFYARAVRGGQGGLH